MDAGMTLSERIAILKEEDVQTIACIPQRDGRICEIDLVAIISELLAMHETMREALSGIRKEAESGVYSDAISADRTFERIDGIAYTALKATDLGGEGA